jgi:methyl-accepting chemotaxis protein
MSIRQRLFASFAALLLFIVAISMVAGSRFNRLAETTRDLVEGDARRAELASAINLHAESAASQLLLLFILEDREQRKVIYQKIDANNAGINQSLDAIRPLMAGPANAQSMERLTALRKTLETRLDETVEALEMGDRALATQRMTGTTRSALDALLAETANMARQQRESMQLRQAQTLQINHESLYIVLALGLAALLLGILMSALMTRRISRPLGQAVDFAERIAGGDLVCDVAHDVPASRRDEFGQLLGAMSHMRNRLRQLIGGILDNAVRVGTAADLLLQPASAVKAGSRQQSELAADIERATGQFSGSIAAMANSMQSVRDEAIKAHDLAQEGASAIVVAADEIGRIAETVDESARSVGRLDQSAKDVAGTVGVIREIAEQTNLLALNASIEAARAGESGRGFAVVADEVRKLAQRTSEATTRIDRVIASINQQIAEATGNIEAGRAGMERGNTLIRSLVAPLETLRDGAQSSLDSLEKLTAEVAGQARESEAIAANVGKIALMAKANEDAAEQVAAITGELIATGAGLQDSVAVFRL